MNDAASISYKSKTAMKWSLLGETFAKVATPLSTIFLARLLSPEIFGITTAVMLIVSFCEAISETGFAKYIIQKDFSSNEEYKKNLSVASFSTVFFSIILCVLIICLNSPLSQFIGNAGYEEILIVSSLQIPITSFNAVFVASLRRDFKFNNIFLLKIIFSLTPFVVTIPLAILGFGPWAVVVGAICAQLFQTPVLIFFNRKNMRFFFSIRYFKTMFLDSFSMIVESTVIWMCTWLTTFFATQLFDSYSVGIIKVSDSTVNNVFSIFNTSLIAVLFPTLSRLKHDKNAFQNAFYSMQTAAFIIMIPLSVGLYFYSSVVCDILLGSSWKDAAHVIGVLSLSAWLMICFNNFVSEVFRSNGHFYSSILYQLIMLGIDVALKSTLGRLSFEMFLWTVPLKNITITIIAIAILKIRYKFSLKKQLISLIPAMLCASFMLPIIFLKTGNESLLKSVFQAIVCATVYFAFGFTLFPNLFKTAISYLGLERLLKKKEHMQ